MKVLIISPHPDDAAFSLGGYLLKNKQDCIAVWDIFSDQEYSISFDMDKGKSVILMEEKQVMDILKCEVIMSGMPEAGMRGYQKLSDILGREISHSEESIIEKVKEEFSKVMDKVQAETIFFPLGCGGHIDHLIVQEAVMRYLGADKQIRSAFLYEEFPYSLNKEWIRKALERLNSCILEEVYLDVTGMEKKKAEIMKIYKSQIREREIRKIISHACSFEESKMIERVWRIR